MMYENDKFWDRIASNYDKIEGNDIAYKIFLDKAKTYLKADDTILDFGCGTGLICNELADNVGFINAIDLSTKMIGISKKKAFERNIKNIDFELTNIFNEKFKEESFDAIIAFNIFHLLDEPQKYFERIYQLLKPNGLILASTPCMKDAPFINLILKFFSFIGVTPKLNSFSSSELEAMLLNASFNTVELSRIKSKSAQYFSIWQKNNK